MKRNKIHKIKLSKNKYSENYKWDESFGDNLQETLFIEWMFYRKDWKHFIYKNWELIPYNT